MSAQVAEAFVARFDAEVRHVVAGGKPTPHEPPRDDDCGLWPGLLLLALLL